MKMSFFKKIFFYYLFVLNDCILLVTDEVCLNDLLLQDLRLRVAIECSCFWSTAVAIGHDSDQLQDL